MRRDIAVFTALCIGLLRALLEGLHDGLSIEVEVALFAGESETRDDWVGWADADRGMQILRRHLMGYRARRALS